MKNLKGEVLVGACVLLCVVVCGVDAKIHTRRTNTHSVVSPLEVDTQRICCFSEVLCVSSADVYLMHAKPITICMPAHMCFSLRLVGLKSLDRRLPRFADVFQQACKAMYQYFSLFFLFLCRAPSCLRLCRQQVEYPYCP